MNDMDSIAPDAPVPDNHEMLPPDDRAVALFWEEARKRAGLTRLDVLVGSSPEAMLPPPAWQFGDSPELATSLLDLVREGVKTSTASAKWEYDEEGEDLPEVGTLGIACDGRGIPRALVRTDAVSVVPFDEVDAAHAAAEGEGDLSLDYWRRVHVRFLREYEGRPEDEPWPAGEPWPSDEMVLEQITCVYPKPTRPRGAGH